MNANIPSPGFAIDPRRRAGAPLRRLLPTVAVSAAAFLLASCSFLPGGEGEDAAPAPSEAGTASAPTSVQTTVITTTETATEEVEPSTSVEPETPGVGGAIDEVQIVIDTTREVSPGVLQYSNYGRASGRFEWKAISNGAIYDAQQCVAVISLVDQAGNVILTDRQNECEGKTKFDLRPSKNPPGEYRVDVSLAPWDAPDSPTEGSLTFQMIAYGT